MENGSFNPEDGRIRIDINAGKDGNGLGAYVFGHEITHFAKEFSPAKYQTFLDVLIQAVGETDSSYESMLDQKISELLRMRRYQNLNEEKLADAAQDEVVAEMCETIFSDTDAAQRMSQILYAKDRTLWGRFKELISDLVDRLREAYKGLNPDSAIARQMKDTVTQNERVLNAWVEAVSDAVENYRMQDGQKKNAREGVRFSERTNATQYDYTKSFEEQVEDYKKGLIPKGDTLLVGKTPEVFLGIGMNNLPVTINTTHVDYALNGAKDFDHHLGEALLKQLPEAIKKPVAIMTSGTKNGSSVVAMLEVRHNGKQVIMPVTIDGFGKQNGIVIDSNAITSIYGKNNSISRVLSDAITQENNGQFRLFYLDEKKATTLLQEARVPMPKNPATHDGGFIHSIMESNSPVKQKIGGVTESQQFKRWFGDWQNDPENASKVVNADGTPKVLYHQTSADFTIFEPRHEGAGTRDQDTPFGIFMKSSDRNIGVKGEKQMALYAKIVNPLTVTDRADLMYQLKRISPEYESASAELRSLNDTYQQKHDDATKAFRDYIVKWRQENLDASRTAIYDDAGFNEIYEAEDNILEEWEAEARKVELRSKEAITRGLEKQGYDGIIIQTDKGSFGRSTDAYIALHPEQVKSATDNLGTFDADNPDIRFSQRQEDALKRQNERQQEEIGRLRELVNIQKYGNKDFTLDQASVKRQGAVPEILSFVKFPIAKIGDCW